MPIQDNKMRNFVEGILALFGLGRPQPRPPEAPEAPRVPTPMPPRPEYPMGVGEDIQDLEERRRRMQGMMRR